MGIVRRRALASKGCSDDVWARPFRFRTKNRVTGSQGSDQGVSSLERRLVSHGWMYYDGSELRRGHGEDMRKRGTEGAGRVATDLICRKGSLRSAKESIVRIFRRPVPRSLENEGKLSRLETRESHAPQVSPMEGRGESAYFF